jgi:hypothetical protein
MATSQQRPVPGPSSFPGERLKLPRSGPGSIVRPGRRIIALLLDWWLALLVVTLIRGPVDGTGLSDAQLVADMQLQSLIVLGVFAALQMVAIAVMGGSIGHRLLGCYVAPLSGGWVGLWRPVVRSILLILVIPAIVWDSDQRGFHDKIAGTVLLRTS